MSRRASGEPIADSEAVAAHPELMPEFARELEVLALLERARIEALSSSGIPGQRTAIPLGPDAFEGYEVLREAHRGGQGIVYEGTQKSTGRRVAIKVMREGLFGCSRDGARFEREVRILGQLDHPGIVGILASGVHAGHFYYVMDFVPGLSLDEDARARPLRERVETFVKVCDAVSDAHLRGIIHRDLKPANILVDDHGQPRILDFGLARITAEWTGPAGSRPTAVAQMTHTGQFVGSLPWSSPEQAAGNSDRIDIRTDVYSLGVILYQIVTGRFPYRVEGAPRDVLDQILTAAPARVRSGSRRGAPHGDDDLEAIILKCLSKERERRYQSGAELAADLRRYLEGRPVLARAPSLAYQASSFVRRHRALVAGAAIAALALLLGLIGTTLGLIEASAGRRSAEIARDVARHRLDDSQRLAYASSIAAADSALRSGDAAAAKARLASAPAALRDWEWRFLAGHTDQSLETLQGPPVWHAIVSPDGRTIGALSRDGRVRILDASTRALRWEAAVPEESRAGHDQRIVCFSPDSALIATAHGPRVLVWRIGTDAPVADLQFPGTRWGFVSGAIDPDRRRIALGGRHARLSIWDLGTGEMVQDFPTGRAYSGLDYSPDGQVLAVGSSEGPVLFEAANINPATAPAQHTIPSGTFWQLRVSPDGSLLAAAQGNDILLLSLPDGTQHAILRGHAQHITAIAFSADGRLLASVGWDRMVRVWDVANAVEVNGLIGHTDVPTGVGFLGSGERLLTSSLDGSIRLWETRATTGPAPLRTNNVVLVLSFVESNSHLFAWTPSDLRLWDLAAADRADRMSGQPAVAGSSTAALSPDGRLLAFARDDGLLVVWDRTAARELWSVQNQSAAVQSFVFSPNGSMLASSSDDGTVRLWRAASGAALQVFRSHGTAGVRPAFSRDGRLLAAADGAGTSIWECASGSLIGTLPPPVPAPGHHLCVAMDPSGQLVATGDSAGTVTIWDAATCQPLRTIPGMQPAVWSIAFNNSGTRLAAGSQDRTIRICDPRSGDELLILRGHTGSIVSLAWSPDDQTLASGSYDNTVRLWSAPELEATQRQP